MRGFLDGLGLAWPTYGGFGDSAVDHELLI